MMLKARRRTGVLHDPAEGAGTPRGAAADEVRWGILSTASIGRTVVPAIAEADGARVVAVAGRDPERTAAFARELDIPRAHGSYDELLADPEVDAIYLPLPIALHAEWARRALEAGKHVLCEKPLAPSLAEVASCFDAAEQAGRHLVEGLMWRRHPRTLRALGLLADGAIGRLLHVRAALTVDAPPGDIRRTGALGGGAHLDLGCYAVSAIRLFAGEPQRVVASQVLDPADGADGGDLRMSALLEMPGDVRAHLDVALDFPRRDELELIGSEGILRIPDPWLCRETWLEIERDGQRTRVDADPEDRHGLTSGEDSLDAYRIEIEQVSREIRGELAPAHDRQDALAQAAVLEALRASAREGRWAEVAQPPSAAHP
jgi:xylose dehydrogenase (NAD/NADP)